MFMRRTLWPAIVLLLLPLVSVVQQLRARAFSNRGMAEYEERWARELPVRFAGRQLRIVDGLSPDAVLARDGQVGVVSVFLDDSLVMGPAVADVHADLPTMARYGRWLSAGRFVARSTSDTTLLVARKRIVEGRLEYDALTIRSGGFVQLDSGHNTRRSSDYPRHRVLSFLGDVPADVYRLQRWSWLPTVFLQTMGPLIGLAGATLYLVVLFWRNTRKSVA